MAILSTLPSPSSLLRNAALDPALTGPLLLLLLYSPPSIRRFLSALLLRPFAITEYTRKFVTPNRLVTALKWLFAIGLAGKANKFLSELALNHGFLTRQGAPWEFGPGGTQEIAVVTGGCSGFGYLIAKGLRDKCRVVVVDVQALPEELKNFPSISYYKCDLTSNDDIASTCSRIRTEVGNPTVLINNAGIGTFHTILNMSDEWLDKIFRVNLMSHFSLIREFLPAMLEMRKGHIVSMASMATYICSANMVDYGAAKAGVLALHEGLNQELRHRYNPAGYSIRTSIVHPTWARTPLTKGWEAFFESNRAHVISAQEVADPVVEQVLAGKSGQIFVPGWLGGASGIRGWPAWLQERLRDRIASLSALRG